MSVSQAEISLKNSDGYPISKAISINTKKPGLMCIKGSAADKLFLADKTKSGWPDQGQTLGIAENVIPNIKVGRWLRILNQKHQLIASDCFRTIMVSALKTLETPDAIMTNAIKNLSEQQKIIVECLTLLVTPWLHAHTIAPSNQALFEFLRMLSAKSTEPKIIACYHPSWSPLINTVNAELLDQ